jgi:hypothetical protein
MPHGYHIAEAVQASRRGAEVLTSRVQAVPGVAEAAVVERHLDRLAFHLGFELGVRAVGVLKGAGEVGEIRAQLGDDTADFSHPLLL